LTTANRLCHESFRVTIAVGWEQHTTGGSARAPAAQKEAPVATPLIPVKTPDGQAELSLRQRKLGQRHRTVLLLVDGRRTEQQVRSLAQQAGAAESCFGELLELGLIAMPPAPAPAPSEPPIATVPMTPPPAVDDAPLHIDIPLDDIAPPVPPPAAFDDTPESVLPATRTLHPESVLDDSITGGSVLRDFDALESGTAHDALEEARIILLQAVRREAPLTGSLTMRKLRRAQTREELAELIDEVETRIVKPYRSLAAQQVLRRARHLLLARADPLPAA
jgi:hypothetical protein